MKQKNKTTSSATKILYQRYVKAKPGMEALLQEELANVAIAQQIYDLRTSVGLSQRELAKLIGTTASVICRLEDADYQGHSLNMLSRIAVALGQNIEIKFVPQGKPRKRHKAS
jgi:ribosome-binding protein aMBF1 (putative translation factor)